MMQLGNFVGRPWWNAAALALALLLPGWKAQAATTSRTSVVHREFVNPTKKVEYEAAARELLQKLQTGFALRVDVVESVENAEPVYTFLATLEATGGDTDGAVASVEQMIQDRDLVLSSRGLASTSESRWVLTELSELSYEPSGWSTERSGYVRYSLNAVSPGKEKAAHKALRGLQSLYRKHDTSVVISVWQLTQDDGTLVIMVGESAGSREELKLQKEDLEVRSGGRDGKLRGEFQEALDHVQVIEGNRRPDLSYPDSPEELEALKSAATGRVKILPMEPLAPKSSPRDAEPRAAESGAAQSRAEVPKVVPVKPLRAGQAAAAQSGPGTVDPTPGQSNVVDVEAFVLRWAGDWSSQRVDDYLSHYSRDFYPPKPVTRSEWEEERRRRLTAPSTIEVEIRSFKVLSQAPTEAWVEFEQEYRSDSYADVVTKTLRLDLEGDAWKIVEEETVSVAPTDPRGFFIVLYSFSEQDRAITRATILRESGFPGAVYATSNGLFAVVISASSLEDQRHTLARLRSEKLAPRDAFRSRGRGLVRRTYPGPS